MGCIMRAVLVGTATWRLSYSILACWYICECVHQTDNLSGPTYLNIHWHFKAILNKQITAQSPQTAELLAQLTAEMIHEMLQVVHLLPQLILQVLPHVMAQPMLELMAKLMAQLV